MYSITGACSRCGSRTWLLTTGDVERGTWKIACENGDRLVPTGVTEFTIELPSLPVRTAEGGDDTTT